MLSLDEPRLMGILNVTPDSFSDGGRFLDPQRAVEHALQLVEDGAAIIDIGGESTRPGARRVDAAEQIARTQPVIRSLREQSDVLISIDTTRYAVAEAALEAGADIINDVSAGREDPAIVKLAAARRCGLIIMHRRTSPEQDSFSNAYAQAPEYGDVVRDVCVFLLDRAAAAEACGVATDAIMLDPGLGFGKTVDQNWELIARSAEFVQTGYPVLAAASRKSFIGAVTGQDDPSGRVCGSLAATVLQYVAGIRVFRVHDVAAQFEVLAVTGAAKRASQEVDAAG
jgi:dihydropteroate synthase